MTNLNEIPPTRQALAEALNLSSEILKNIELTEIPLANIALKAIRLARLLNDFSYQKIMEYEAGGYPVEPGGVSPIVWDLGKFAGRVYKETDTETKEVQEYIYRESINEMEETLRTAEVALSAARDSDTSISSANPNQFVNTNSKSNQLERTVIRRSISQEAQRIASRRTFIYQYALRIHYELKFSGIADDIFTRVRQRTDDKIGRLIPDSIQKITAIYEGLSSENSENWSNAVHSCRRILQDLADVLFPPTNDEKIVEVGGKKRTIKLGKDQYINRIMAFVENSSQSTRYENIVGSHLEFLGERLDSVFKAAQKGSHDIIVSKEEADRYVVYTYLLVGDILSLNDEWIQGSSRFVTISKPL